MSDVNVEDLVKGGVSGATVIGLLWGAVRMLGGRQLSQHDETMKKLATSVDSLTAQVQSLREDNARNAEKMGAQSEGLKANRERIDEATKFWREQLAELSGRVQELSRNIPTKGKGSR